MVTWTPLNNTGFDKARKKEKLPKNNAYHFDAKKEFINNYDQDKMSISLKLAPVISYPEMTKDKVRFTEFFEKNTKYMVKDSKKKTDKMNFV